MRQRFHLVSNSLLQCPTPRLYDWESCTRRAGCAEQRPTFTSTCCWLPHGHAQKTSKNGEFDFPSSHIYIYLYIYIYIYILTNIDHFDPFWSILIRFGGFWVSKNLDKPKSCSQVKSSWMAISWRFAGRTGPEWITRMKSPDESDPRQTWQVQVFLWFLVARDERFM